MERQKGQPDAYSTKKGKMSMAEVRWIKIQTDLFSNRKIKLLSSMEDGDSLIIIWLQLLCLAGEINDGGYLYLTDGVPYTEDILAVQMNKSKDIVRKALEMFKRFGMVEEDNGYLCISNWDRYQNVDRMSEIREYNRLNKQKYREKKKSEDMSSDKSRTSPRTMSKDKSKEMSTQSRAEKNREDKSKSSSTDTAADSLYERACMEFGSATVHERMQKYPRAKIETIYKWLSENRKKGTPSMTHDYDFSQIESEVLAGEA